MSGVSKQALVKLRRDTCDFSGVARVMKLGGTNERRRRKIPREVGLAMPILGPVYMILLSWDEMRDGIISMY